MEDEAFRAQVREMIRLMVSAACAKRAGNMLAASMFAQQLLKEAEQAGVKALCVAACSALETLGNFPPEAIEAASPQHMN